MSDDSHLDAQYFVNTRFFNCPFCKRNNLPYSVVGSIAFNFSASEKDLRQAFAVACISCGKQSLHLATRPIARNTNTGRALVLEDDKEQIDDLIFASIPSSRFVLATSGWERTPRLRHSRQLVR